MEFRGIDTKQWNPGAERDLKCYLVKALLSSGSKFILCLKTSSYHYPNGKRLWVAASSLEILSSLVLRVWKEMDKAQSIVHHISFFSVIWLSSFIVLHLFPSILFLNNSLSYISLPSCFSNLSLICAFFVEDVTVADLMEKKRKKKWFRHSSHSSDSHSNFQCFHTPLCPCLVFF